MREYRAREAGNATAVTVPVSTSRQMLSELTQAEADTEADTKAQKNKEARASRVDHGFESWWTAYPKKTGKGAAAIAWKKIKPSEPVIGQMRDALAWQRNQPQWTKDAGAYIPNPATYLNQRRWEDEPFHTSPVAVAPSNDRHAQKIRDIEAGVFNDR